MEDEMRTFMKEVRDELASINTNVALINQTLETHTASDTDNFAKLTDALSKLAKDIEIIKLERAREAGANAEAEKAGKQAGMRWAAGFSALVAAIIEGVRLIMSSGSG